MEDGSPTRRSRPRCRRLKLAERPPDGSPRAARADGCSLRRDTRFAPRCRTGLDVKSGHRLVMEECIRAEWSGWCHISPRQWARPRGRTDDENQLYSAAGSASHTSIRFTRAPGGLRVAHGPRWCREPRGVFGPGDNCSSRAWSLIPDRAPALLDVRRRSSTCATWPPGTPRRGAREIGSANLSGGNFTYDASSRLGGSRGSSDGEIAHRRRAGAGEPQRERTLWPLTEATPRAGSGGPTGSQGPRELGWQPRPHEETLEATVAWHLEREHERMARTRGSQAMTRRLAALAVGAGEIAAGVLRRLPLPRP